MADTAQLTYAGQPLLFDYRQQAQRFLDRYLRMEDLVVPPDNTARHDWHCNTYGDTHAGLPRPNYPAAPRARINTLYWPTGAARWAQGWFLANGATVDKLIDRGNPEAPWYNGESVSCDLKIASPAVGDESPYELVVPLYLLRPLQVTATLDQDYQDLWILPLVDQRYWWQFRNAGDLEDQLESWASLFYALNTALGITLVYTTVDSAYLTPDPIELYRSHDNAAVLLDAAAHSIGRRVVCDYDGTVRLADYTTEATALETNYDELKSNLGLIAGRPDEWKPPHNAPLPFQVTVAFPKSTGTRCAETHHTEDITLTSLQSTLQYEDPVTVASVRKTVHCTNTAQMPSSGSVPTNYAELLALAIQYATDYYGWLLYCYDHCWAGLQRWIPTGYDDHVLFEIGVEYPEEIQAFAQTNEQFPDVWIHERLARRYQTRVQSMPANFGVSSILCGGHTCSTGTEIISFRVLAAGPFYSEIDVFCLRMRCEVLDVSCNGSSVAVGDEVDVWDPDGTYFSVPVDILLNCRGTAVKMAWDSEQGISGDCFREYTEEEIADLPYAGQCWWMVTALSCVEEWYDSPY